MARNFWENRLDSVAEHFAYPMPLYADDGLQVFGAACTLKEGLSLYRDAAIRAGIVRMNPRILAEGLTVNGYSNVWVEWDHINADGVCLRTSQVHYVFYRDAGALFPRIELVEYTVLAFPEVPASIAMPKIA
ncbi:hypothetical protein [uncultured Tateyamaria sp.]|uniref:hypothetical protein n=1 Tax=uncultured Tateyamaria sp. TaxID=455651 RepID=UPI002629F41F|nr:hypothetical protein [uncultured Tateyamaria sp.]